MDEKSWLVRQNERIARENKSLKKQIMRTQVRIDALAKQLGHTPLPKNVKLDFWKLWSNDSWFVLHKQILLLLSMSLLLIIIFYYGAEIPITRLVILFIVGVAFLYGLWIPAYLQQYWLLLDHGVEVNGIALQWRFGLGRHLTCEYEFNGETYRVKNNLAWHLRDDYPADTKIPLVVNAKSPHICIVKDEFIQVS